MAKGGTGLKRETAAALATLLGPTLVVPVLFILLEKDEFVRFWAFQSIVVFLTLFILNWVLALTVFLIILTPLVFILGLVLWLLMTYKAWQGDEWKVPFIGNLAVKLMKKA
jgi:uncharacterized membrane protein